MAAAAGPAAPSDVVGAAARGAVTGAFGGLVAGIVYGVWAEKVFVLRNAVKPDHLKEGIERLFPLMTRGASTAAVGAAFLGTLAALRAVLHPRVLEDRSHPALGGAAGAAAGAVRTAVHQAGAHPLVHVQRSAAAGALSAAVFGFHKLASAALEEEKQRRAVAAAAMAQQRRQQGEQQGVG